MPKMLDQDTGSPMIPLKMAWWLPLTIDHIYLQIWNTELNQQFCLGLQLATAVDKYR